MDKGYFFFFLNILHIFFLSFICHFDYLYFILFNSRPEKSDSRWN